MVNIFDIGDSVISIDPTDWYRGKVAQVRDFDIYDHCVVYTVGIQTDNSVITFAVRQDNLVEA